MKTQNLAANILIWSALLIGILLLFSGLKGTIERKTLFGGYETAEGHFFDYEIYSEGGYDAIRHRYTNDTYRLIYTYRVNGRDYTVSTDMGTGMIPDYGSVKTVRYNPDQPDDAFLEGPNRHGFKIFFGLFFIAIPSFFLWLLKPEKKEEKKEKKTSLDGIGMAIGLALMVFSYGMLYFITGELSLRGMINFYRTSFILPMAAPVLLMAAGGYLLIRSLFLGRKKAGRTGKTEEAPKYKVRTIAGCILIACLFLFFSAGGESLYGGSKFLPEGNREQTEGNAAEKADFAAVHAMLSERGFETANITTTYWFYDENKITNVVSGIKGGDGFRIL